MPKNNLYLVCNEVSESLICLDIIRDIVDSPNEILILAPRMAYLDYLQEHTPDLLLDWKKQFDVYVPDIIDILKTDKIFEDIKCIILKDCSQITRWVPDRILEFIDKFGDDYSIIVEEEIPSINI